MEREWIRKGLLLYLWLASTRYPHSVLKHADVKYNACWQINSWICGTGRRCRKYFIAKFHKSKYKASMNFRSRINRLMRRFIEQFVVALFGKLNTVECRSGNQFQDDPIFQIFSHFMSWMMFDFVILKTFIWNLGSFIYYEIEKLTHSPHPLPSASLHPV